MHSVRRRCSWLATGLFLVFALNRSYAQVAIFLTPYVTRAEAVMLLLQARVPKVPAVVSSGEFPDVKRGAWYERYVIVSERLGILQADPKTRKVRPDDPVTRAEFLGMTARTFGINTTLFSSTYTDVPKDAWYAQDAAMAQRLRLFPGDTDQKKLRPNDAMTHSEAAKAVQILTSTTAGAQYWSGALPRRVSSAGSSVYQKISTSTQEVAIVNAGQGTRSSVPGFAARPAAPGADPANIVALRTDVLGLVNAARTKANLRPLRRDVSLEQSAQQYARDMAQRDFFGHLSPGGETLKVRMERSGYYSPFFQSDCLCIAQYLLGENLARGQKTAKEVVTDWFNSSTHRTAMMNPGFTDTGIGISAGVWVQHFGGKQK